MDLGAFSISLSVRDLDASRQFYERLGFHQVAGDPGQNWLILKNGQTVIGLFEGMFEGNLLTFNPGWDQDQNEVPGFTDIRDLQRQLRERGIVPTSEADEHSSGPTHMTLTDPDGNVLLIDQHVG